MGRVRAYLKGVIGLDYSDIGRMLENNPNDDIGWFEGFGKRSRNSQDSFILLNKRLRDAGVSQANIDSGKDFFKINSFNFHAKQPDVWLGGENVFIEHKCLTVYEKNETPKINISPREIIGLYNVQQEFKCQVYIVIYNQKDIYSRPLCMTLNENIRTMAADEWDQPYFYCPVNEDRLILKNGMILF